MKKLIAFIIVFLFWASGSFAQSADTLKPVVPYDTFPIGGLRYPFAGFLSSMLGMNFNIWDFGPVGTNHTFPMQGVPDIPSSNEVDPFNRDTVNQHIIHDPYTMLLAASYGVDARIYATGVSGKTEEYNYKWIDTVGVDTLNQFKIPSDGRVQNLQYVATLSDLVHPWVTPNSVSDIYGPGGWGQPTLDTSYISTFSYELVYFFTQTDTASVNGTDPLYSIEYWIKKADDSVYRFIAADTITKNSYKTISFAVTPAPGHDVNSEKLSTWFAGQQNIYKIQKRILNLRPYYENGSTPLVNSPLVDVRIRTFKKIPMWLRLLRIRDWVGQRLLSGNADVQLDSAIKLLRTYHGNDTLKSWTVASEENYRNFHAWSYLNDFAVHKQAPPLNVLAPIDYDLFQRVMHDQTQYDQPYVKSGILLHEWTPFAGEGWRTVGSGIPHQRYWDYNNHSGSFPPTPMPFPFAVSGDTITPFFRGISIIQGYDNYTYHWQHDIIGYNSEADGGGVGDCQSQYQKAKACYLYDPQHIQPYWLMTQANPYRFSLAKFWVDSLYFDKRISLGEAKAALWADSIYAAAIINPYLSRHDTDVISEDSLFDPMWAVRAPSRAESYYQFWSGVEHGMKGYIVNICYDDQLIQNGIVFDTILKNGKDSIIKSQYRTGITIKESYLSNPYNDNHHYGTKQFYRYLAMPPGFKQMFPTFRSIITEELAPIALTLSQLNWKGVVSWHKRDSASHSLSLLPVKNVHSKTKSGTTDPDSATYVDLGIHKHPTDSAAIFVSFLNRRLYSDAEDTLSTDYRTISFKVDNTKFGKDSTYSKWLISDVSNQLPDTVVSTSDTFSFTVKPGQGKLFRIAPAFGMNLGRITDNLFNNGRHIAAVDTSQYGVKQYLTTYARNGKIAVSYPVETPSGSEKRVASTPHSDTVIFIDTSGRCYNPSIAYNHAYKTIGITYRKVVPHNPDPHVPGSGNDTTWICFQQAPYSAPYVFSSMKVLDTLLTTFNFVAPPAIAPRDSSYIDSLKTKKFWVAYNSSDSGGTLLLLDANGNVARKKHFLAPDAQAHYVKFVSIATHVPFDTVHIAFEEGNGNDGQIYYTRGYLDGSGALQINQNPATNISLGLNSCQNHNPQIAVWGLNFADVVWESVTSQNVGVEGKSARVNHYSVLRSRMGILNNQSGSWSNYTTFLTRSFEINATYLAHNPYMDRIYPNISSTSSVLLDTSRNPTWRDWQRITWSNLDKAQIEITRYGLSNGFTTSFWNRYLYLEPSQEPAMPSLSFGDLAPQPFLYRYTTKHSEDGLYDARIIRYDFPSNPILSVGNQFQILKAFPNGVINCGLLMKAKIGNVQLTSIIPDTTKIITLHQFADSATDPNGYKPIQWNDKKGVHSYVLHVSSGNTLKYQRDFQVGTYHAGDTSSVAAYLSSSSDYLMARVYLRQASNDSVIAILDSARLKTSGFVQSITFSDSGWRIAPILSTNDVYLTMEMSRGDSLDGFDLSYTIAHDDIFHDQNPNDSTTSFKKAAQPPITQQSIPSEAHIKLTVNPNPFEESTHVSLDVPKDIPLNVSLFDLLGRPALGLFNNVANKEHIDFTIHKGEISQGTYLLRVQSGNDVVTRKIQLVK